MRFPKKKVSARATALALALGVTAVLVTALPASAASVTSFTPTCGIAGVAGVGTSVTITGSGFTGATGVTFNGTPTAAVTFAVVSDTTATATAPVGATTGTITVETAAADTPSASNFTVVTAAAPGIPTFAPTSGAIGASVVITGTNFCGTSFVQFNTTAATFTVNSSTQITATVPVGATTGPVRVTVPGQATASSATSFTVTGVPTITSFSPTSGNVGTSVVITGTNLLGVTSVRFNGLAATFTTSTATSVTATVPTSATTGKVSLTTPGGTATSAADFTVTTAPVARTVSFRFEPNSRVSGQVTSSATACVSRVRVVIQRQRNGSWTWADTTATTDSGSYKTYIPPSNGRFRARIAQFTLVNGVVCGADTSNVVNS